MSTQHSGSRLETLPNSARFREQVVVRSAALADRFASVQRKDMFLALFKDAPRQPQAIYDLRQDKTNLPDERQRQLIHDGIRAGYISREQVIRYRASQVRDDLAAFPDARQADDTLYCALMVEAGEMVEAQSVARGVPTREHIERAVRETEECVSVAQMLTASQREGAA